MALSPLVSRGQPSHQLLGLQQLLVFNAQLLQETFPLRGSEAQGGREVFHEFQDLVTDHWAVMGSVAHLKISIWHIFGHIIV